MPLSLFSLIHCPVSGTFDVSLTSAEGARASALNQNISISSLGLSHVGASVPLLRDDGYMTSETASGIAPFAYPVLSKPGAMPTKKLRRSASFTN